MPIWQNETPFWQNKSAIFTNKTPFFWKKLAFFSERLALSISGLRECAKKNGVFSKKIAVFFRKIFVFFGFFKLGCSRKRIYSFPGYFPPQRKRSDQYFSSKRLIVTPFEVDACMNVSLSIKIPTWLVLPPGTLLKKTKSPSLIV